MDKTAKIRVVYKSAFSTKLHSKDTLTQNATHETVADILGHMWDSEDYGVITAFTVVAGKATDPNPSNILLVWEEFGNFAILWDNFDERYEQYISYITDMWVELEKGYKAAAFNAYDV